MIINVRRRVLRVFASAEFFPIFIVSCPNSYPLRRDSPLMSDSSSIAVIYMGGTFGCIGEPLKPMSASAFLPVMRQLIGAELPAIHYFTSSSLIKDSSQLNPTDWIDLIAQINTLVSQGFTQIIIIHGTDTLAFTAAFLAHYFAASDLRLVVTGSQFPLLTADGSQLHPSSDALANLRLAHHHLMSHHDNTKAITNCWVSFDGKIWPALTVQKIHTTQTPTFAGVSTVANDDYQPMCSPTRLNNTCDAKPIIGLNQLEALTIAIYYALPLSVEQQAAQLQHYLSLHHLQAIIILAFGSGNLSQHPLIEHTLQQAVEQQIMVIIASQVPFGGVNSRYAAGDWLTEYGVLSAGHLPLPAIYARLAYLFCQQLSFAERQQQWRLA